VDHLGNIHLVGAKSNTRPVGTTRERLAVLQYYVLLSYHEPHKRDAMPTLSSIFTFDDVFPASKHQLAMLLPIIRSGTTASRPDDVIYPVPISAFAGGGAWQVGVCLREKHRQM
jgi:hypothetical protein